MSYRSLARKWRPKIFKDVVAQEINIETIKNSLQNNNLHYCYLLTGTRGVGKTTIARIIAKVINCTQSQDFEPCNSCKQCISIDNQNNPDIIEIDAASRTQVEDTKEILSSLNYKPIQSKYKVIIVDEVHMLSKHSFNALLKTLEEPPEHVLFILATTEKQKIPITVKSRCISFNLFHIGQQAIVDRFKFILEQEGVTDYDEKALKLIASNAKGSMRDGLSILEQALAFCNNQINHDKTLSLLGLLSKENTLELVKNIIQKNTQECLQLIDLIENQTEDFHLVVDEILEILLAIHIKQLSDYTHLSNYDDEQINQLASYTDANYIQVLYEIAIHAKKDMDYAPSNKISFTMCVLRMLHFNPVEFLEKNNATSQLKDRIQTNESQTQIEVDKQNSQSNLAQKKTLENFSSLDQSTDLNSDKLVKPELKQKVKSINETFQPSNSIKASKLEPLTPSPAKDQSFNLSIDNFKIQNQMPILSQENWQTIINLLVQKDNSLNTDLLKNSRVEIKLEGDKRSLKIISSVPLQAEFKNKINQLLPKLYQQKLNIEFDTSEQKINNAEFNNFAFLSPAQISKSELELELTKRCEQVMQDESIKKISEMFEGELIPDSIIIKDSNN